MSEIAFDAVAKTYDASFTHTKIGLRQRTRVWHFLAHELPKNKSLKILEINCGTGVDARFLQSKGHRVVATDISPNMISVASENSTNAIQFETIGFEQLAVKFEGFKFDLIFSNFAGLNCVSAKTLEKLDHHFAHLLRADGKLIVVMLGKYCLAERFYFNIKKKPERATQRLTESVANIDGVSRQTTWCYSKDQMLNIFKQFKINKVKPIGLFVPPSYFEQSIKKIPGLLHILYGLELIFGSFGLFADYADHIYLSFSRK